MAELSAATGRGLTDPPVAIQSIPAAKDSLGRRITTRLKELVRGMVSVTDAETILKGGLKALAGGAVLSVASYMVLPAVSPRIELRIFNWTGVALASPYYMVMASTQAVQNQTTSDNDRIAMYRVFCGWSSPLFSKPDYCVMRMVNVDQSNASRSLDDRPLIGASWDVMHSENGERVNLAWGETKEGTMGSAEATKDWASQAADFGTDWSGKGRACVMDDKPGAPRNRRTEDFYVYVGPLGSLRSSDGDVKDPRHGTVFEKTLLKNMGLHSVSDPIMTKVSATPCGSEPGK